MKKNAFFFLFIFAAILLFENKSFGEARTGYGDPVMTYEKDGIKIVSFSSTWRSKDQLQKLYEELMSNVHGVEIKYLAAVYVYPDSPDKVSGLYHGGYEMGPDGAYVVKSKRYIDLYNGDRLTSVSQMAKILSHEYGHHFFSYYLLDREGLKTDQWKKSTYYQVRQLYSYPKVTSLIDTEKTYIHEWDLVEILSEDYVQIYGSPLARQTQDFLDAQERVNQNLTKYTYSYSMFNLLPQENLDLPLAADVNGLVDYFVSLTKLEPLHRPEKLSMQAPKLKEIQYAYDDHKSYVFKWSALVNLKSFAYEYTLLLNKLGQNDFPTPLKTVIGTEPMVAVAGSAINAAKTVGLPVNYEGDYQIRVLLKDAYGYMHSSSVAPVVIMDNAFSMTYFKDVFSNFWARPYIYGLAAVNLIKGYPDGNFGIKKTMTRAEFITVLIRTMDGVTVKSVDTGNDWFSRQGYFDAAKALGMISATQSASFYNLAIKREEIAHYMRIAMDYSGIRTTVDVPNQLMDVAFSEYVQDIYVMNYYFIIEGYEDGTFKPTNSATRSEVAKMMSKYLEVMNGGN